MMWGAMLMYVTLYQEFPFSIYVRFKLTSYSLSMRGEITTNKDFEQLILTQPYANIIIVISYQYIHITAVFS